MPHPLEDEEILQLIERFAEAARRAERAGFDFIELHAAHGYLIFQFLSPLSNQRTDRWGGSLENRMRLVVEIARAVKKAAPKLMAAPAAVWRGDAHGAAHNPGGGLPVAISPQPSQPATLAKPKVFQLIPRAFPCFLARGLRVLRSAQEMSLPEKAFPVSWDQFHRDARALAWRLASANKGQWKAIVCITRGGLVPAAIISRELGIRVIETVCVASYHGAERDLREVRYVRLDERVQLSGFEALNERNIIGPVARSGRNGNIEQNENQKLYEIRLNRLTPADTVSFV